MYQNSHVYSHICNGFKSLLHRLTSATSLSVNDEWTISRRSDNFECALLAHGSMTSKWHSLAWYMRATCKEGVSNRKATEKSSIKDIVEKNHLLINEMKNGIESVKVLCKCLKKPTGMSLGQFSHVVQDKHPTLSPTW